MPQSLDRSRRKLKLTSEERALRCRVRRLMEQLGVSQKETCESLNQLTEPGATVILDPHLARWLAGKEPSNQHVSKLLDAVCPLWANARETEANTAGGVEEVARQRQQEQQDQQRLLLQQQQAFEQQRALLLPQVLEMLARGCPGLSQSAFSAALSQLAQCGEGVISQGQISAWLNGTKTISAAAGARLNVVLKAWLEAKESEVAAAGGAGAFERQQAEKIEAENAAKAATRADKERVRAEKKEAEREERERVRAEREAEKAEKDAEKERARAEREAEKAEKEAEKERARAEREAEKERVRAEKEAEKAARPAQAETSDGDERAVREQRLRGGLKAPVAGPLFRYFSANLELMRSEAWQARMWAALAAQPAAQPNKTLLLQLIVREAVLVHQPTPLPADSPLAPARARSQGLLLDLLQVSAEEPLAQLLSRQPMLALSMPSSLCTNWWVGTFTITLMFELADKFGGARLDALQDFGSFLPAARELLQDVMKGFPHKVSGYPHPLSATLQNGRPSKLHAILLAWLADMRKKATFTPAELGHLKSLSTHTLIDKINATIDQVGGLKVAELIKWLMHSTDRAEWSYAKTAIATLGLGRDGDALQRLEKFDSAAETFCQHLFGKGVANQDVRENAYVYVNNQNWFGFKKPNKKRKSTDEPDCSCSADGGI